METKTAKFRRLFKEQKYKDALRVIKSFKMALKKEQIRTLSIAWECITGNESFYRQLGHDTEAIKMDAYQIMLEYAYGNELKA